MDTHEWVAREKLIDWDVQSVYSSFHPFEMGFIIKAVEYWVSTRSKMNPISQEVYDHLQMRWTEMQGKRVGKFPYPSEKALKAFESSESPPST